MKLYLVCVTGVLCLLSSGCFPGYSLRNLDAPGGDNASLWQKPGETRLDVGKARLECGALNPWDETKDMLERAGYIDFGDQLNHWIQLDACMEKAGYKNRLTQRHNVESYAEFGCNNWKKRYTLPACQPGAPVMERSVERRLNSEYCKTSPLSYEHCKATAKYPPGCDNITIPDPVCLP